MTGSLCNCGGPSPEGYHEPHCLENGIMQSLDREHPHWSFHCPDCGYRSPFFHANELAARAAFQGHLQGCSGDRPKRADGFTREQAERWCVCMRNRTPDNFEGPQEDCPLHGAYTVEWAVFRRDTFLETEFEPMGVSYATDEYPGPDALERAEDELESIVRYDERNAFVALKYQLRYRLIGPWTAAGTSKPTEPKRYECGCDGTPHWGPDGCPPRGLRHA